MFFPVWFRRPIGLAYGSFGKAVENTDPAPVFMFLMKTLPSSMAPMANSGTLW
jgi:hypothetical protein